MVSSAVSFTRALYRREDILQRGRYLGDTRPGGIHDGALQRAPELLRRRDTGQSDRDERNYAAQR